MPQVVIDERFAWEPGDFFRCGGAVGGSLARRLISLLEDFHYIPSISSLLLSN